MDTRAFIDGLIPGNYFITKSMELTKSQSSGTLWYTKKFIVLYYYIFLNGNINTLATAKEICDIFDGYINSLPKGLQENAKNYFYASHKVADLRDKDFKLFWNINRKAGSVGKQFIHPAIYPNDLVSRIIQITTYENDKVLDPFLGSGTTLITAIQTGRNCIGYEYNEGFKELINSRYLMEVGEGNISFIVSKYK